MKEIARRVGIGALKFADLSNHRSKDYVFDIDKFCSFEGKTGPYIQYSAVRAASIINKAQDSAEGEILLSEGDVQTELFLLLTEHQTALENAAADFAPNAVAEYAYKLASALNKYYHEYKVLVEEDEEKRKSRLSTLELALRVLNKMMEILAIEIPERM